MIETAFILLLYSGGEILESSYNESLGECLMTRRQIQRYYGTDNDQRWACELYRVETEEILGRKYVAELIEKVTQEDNIWDPRVVR